jgi:hypothetical protein
VTSTLAVGLAVAVTADCVGDDIGAGPPVAVAVSAVVALAVVAPEDPHAIARTTRSSTGAVLVTSRSVLPHPGCVDVTNASRVRCSLRPQTQPRDCSGSVRLHELNVGEAARSTRQGRVGGEEPDTASARQRHIESVGRRETVGKEVYLG